MKKQWPDNRTLNIICHRLSFLRDILRNMKVILLTPSRDRPYGTRDGSWQALVQHAELLLYMIHPNWQGHEVIAGELLKWLI